MEHVLSASDDGSRLRAEVGDRLVVRLPENAGTGFLWALEVPGGLRQVEDEPEPAPPGSGIGAAGLRRLVLDVERPGRYELRARLAQPWAADVVDATWHVTLDADG